MSLSKKKEKIISKISQAEEKRRQINQEIRELREQVIEVKRSAKVDTMDRILKNNEAVSFLKARNILSQNDFEYLTEDE